MKIKPIIGFTLIELLVVIAIMANLVKNGTKYGGACVCVSASHANDELDLCVEDDGVLRSFGSAGWESRPRGLQVRRLL